MKENRRFQNNGVKVTVVAIILIMTAPAIPSFRGVMNLINNARCYLNQRHIRDAVPVYYTDRPFVNSRTALVTVRYS